MYELERLATMQRIRRFEEKIADLRHANEVVGSVHLCIGQEAIAVGALEGLDIARDAVFPTYRGHGWSIACGVPLAAMFGELLGRESGINGGRGGSAYHFAPRYGMFGENSIVGAGTVIAAGSALAAQFDGSGRVSVAVIGDGAMNQGSVHEALNFSAVRRLPMIFIVENNRYSELTPISAMARVDRLYRRANPYGITACRIDGNDVDGVAVAVGEARDRISAGGGPVLIEAMTERLAGHYIGDAQTYRTKAEIDEAWTREPIQRYSDSLVARGVSLREIEATLGQVDAEIESALEIARMSPLADAGTVLEHLYA